MTPAIGPTPPKTAAITGAEVDAILNILRSLFSMRWADYFLKKINFDYLLIEGNRRISYKMCNSKYQEIAFSKISHNLRVADYKIQIEKVIVFLFSNIILLDM